MSRPATGGDIQFFLTFRRTAAIILLIVQTQSEVNDINKQRFLAELGKLLTFMCEEDRHTALAMYNKMFDDAVDEQQLMELLASPTRQAVVIARTYNANERKHQLESPDREGPVEMPPFMLAIDKLYQQVAPRPEEPEEEEEEEPAVVADQFSLFEDDAHPIDDSEYVPFQIEAEAVSLEEPVEELPLDQAAEEAEEAAEEVSEETETEPASEAPAEQAQEDAPAFSAPESPAAETVIQPAEQDSWEPALPAEPEELRPKAKVGLLILYILIAVPVTLAGIVLLLIPTLLSLALAIGVIAGGAAVLVAAFSGFPKLADILIVLGTALIVLALGLLLLWLFIWFVGGAIAGLVRGVIELGRKWCYKEVQA